MSVFDVPTSTPGASDVAASVVSSIVIEPRHLINFKDADLQKLK
jgi:hypothetical protein